MIYFLWTSYNIIRFEVLQRKWEPAVLQMALGEAMNLKDTNARKLLLEAKANVDEELYLYFPGVVYLHDRKQYGYACGQEMPLDYTV